MAQGVQHICSPRGQRHCFKAFNDTQRWLGVQLWRIPHIMAGIMGTNMLYKSFQDTHELYVIQCFNQAWTLQVHQASLEPKVDPNSIRFSYPASLLN